MTACYPYIIYYWLLSWLQPERIKVTNIETGYDVRADVWSLGISLVRLLLVLYSNYCSPQVELSTAVFPYSNFSGDFQVLAAIVNDDPPIPTDTNLSPELVNFISLWWVLLVIGYYGDELHYSLTKDYEKRPSFKNLLVSSNVCSSYSRLSASYEYGSLVCWPIAPYITIAYAQDMAPYKCSKSWPFWVDDNVGMAT